MAARTLLLRANALFLTLAALGGLRADLSAALFGTGPFAPVIGMARDTAIGFVEAHGLALIFGALLWRAQPSRQWHAVGAAIHALLGASNLAFWPLFEATGTLGIGVLTTALHGAFFALHTLALLTFRPVANAVAP